MLIVTDLLELREEPPPGSGQHRARRGVGRAIAVLLLLALVVGLVLGGRALISRVSGGGSDDYTGPGTGEVTVQIEPGDTAAQIGAQLVDKGVVRTRSAFFSVARDDPRAKELQPGFYRLKKQMPAAAAFDLLLDPSARLVGRVVVPEGLTVAQTLETLAKGSDIPLADYQSAAKATGELGLPDYAKGRLEGFLFPATYEIDPGMSAKDVLSELVARFNQAAESVDLVAGAEKLGRTPYEVVTVASLIEREVRRDADYPKVASVVYNRLEKGEPLGIDASTLFGVGKTAGGQLTKSDLAKDTPYETRRRAGLPPTPIASPGEATLKGALNPAPGDLRWYVLADADGTTAFFDDYDAFLAQKRKSQAAGLL